MADQRMDYPESKAKSLGLKCFDNSMGEVIRISVHGKDRAIGDIVMSRFEKHRLGDKWIDVWKKRCDEIFDGFNKEVN